MGDSVISDLEIKSKKKLPRQLAGLVALRTQGFDNREIADKLGVSVPTVKRWIAKARREYGWSDLGAKLTDVALPQAVDNIIAHLEHEGTPCAVKEGMSTMTRELARGLGAFKTHAAVKTEKVKTSIQVLKVEITMPTLPPGDQGATRQVEGVLATPRRALPAPSNPAPAVTAPVIEGEVVAEI